MYRQGPVRIQVRALTVVALRRHLLTVGFMAMLIATVPTLATAALSGAASTQGGEGTFGVGMLGTVDEATGAASVNIPIEVPRARGVAQPNLSLVYSSSRALGDVAVGWSLRVPAIERTGTVAGLPDARGRLVFDGQPLVWLGVVQNSSCPVPGCTEQMPVWAINWSYYRLHSEGTFARFFHRGSTWRVQFRSGEGIRRSDYRS